MSDVKGVKVADLTASGASDDGGHVWITHRLGDGSEYPLIYPFEAVGYLLTVLMEAARSAARRRVARNPQEAASGLDADVIPIEAVRIGTAPDGSGAILHLTTADNIPIAVEVPAALLGDLAEGLRQVQERLGSGAGRSRLH